MKLFLLLAALLVAAWAKPNTRSTTNRATSLDSARSYLSMMGNHYRKDNLKMGRETDGSDGEDEEDEDSIFAALLHYMQENNIQQYVQDDLRRRKQKAKQRRTLDKPHIIYFLIDDLGYNDITWNNADVKTPFLDTLTAEGTILDQAYAQPVCSPSRGALMTGLYPFHNGMQHDVIQWTSPECAPLDLSFLPEKLGEVGYKSHMVGKWHLGFCNEACTPTARGFDTFYGFYQGYIDHYTHLTGATGLEGYDWQEEDAASGTRKGVPENDGENASELTNARALEIIADADPNEPMFLYYAHAGVHTPIQTPDEFIDMYADSGLDEHRAHFLAMVSQVDDTMKQVVEALKAKGMYENSVIIFQSDNGGEFHAGSNAPLRGSKTSVYEAGTRTPAMFFSPLASDAAKGVRSNGLFHITDWYATIASMAGADASGTDGVDQTSLLLDGGASARTEMVYNIDSIFPGLFGEGAIRIGDWKLIQGYPGLFDGWESEGTMDQTHLLDLLNNGKRAASKATRGNYAFDFPSIMAYIAQNKNVLQLFNIADDPEEHSNVADANPDKVEELLERLHELREEERVPDLSAQIPEPAGEAGNFGGIWTPGWC